MVGKMKDQQGVLPVMWVSEELGSFGQWADSAKHRCMSLLGASMDPGPADGTDGRVPCSK